MSYMVGNPEYKFSTGMAQFLVDENCGNLRN